MQPLSFVADSAAEAVARIRARLGPEAVVLNVRKLPASGLAKFWQKPRIEVLAYRPEAETDREADAWAAEASNAAASTSGTVAVRDAVQTESLAFRQLREELEEIKRRFSATVETATPATPAPAAQPAMSHSCAPTASSALEPQVLPFDSRPRSLGIKAGGWRVGAMCETTGVLPWHAQRLVDELQSRHGPVPPAHLVDELALAREVMTGWWRPARDARAIDARPHVMIGPPGVGKTTVLCKWLAQAVLVEGARAHVWRLDGATANAAESLSVYCEILGVPLERAWTDVAAETQAGAGERRPLSFVDVPGVDWRSPDAVRALSQWLGALGQPRVHLVLNAAYEVPLLLAQARTFAPLPVEDIILTHLDEEPRWGKVWNLVLGTNFSVRCLSAGQNVPGNFLEATPELILNRQFAP